MFDENGERYQRRSGDPWWRWFVPAFASIGIALFGWGVSVESRIDNIASIQQERAGVLAQLKERIEEVDAEASNPAPRPQAKVLFDQMTAEHKMHEERINRLEERFNNFHQFLLQTRQLIVPPSKRGSLPFKPEDQG